MFTWKYEGKGSRKRVGLHEGWSFVKHPCTEKYKGKGFRKNICAQRNTKGKISGKTFVYREIQRERFQEKWSLTERWSLIRGSSVFADFIVVTRLAPLSITGVNVPLCLLILL